MAGADLSGGPPLGVPLPDAAAFLGLLRCLGGLFLGGPLFLGGCFPGRAERVGVAVLLGVQAEVPGDFPAGRESGFAGPSSLVNSTSDRSSSSGRSWAVRYAASAPGAHPQS